MLSLAALDRRWLGWATLGSVLQGLEMPAFSIFYAQVVQVFYGTRASAIDDGAALYASLFLALALAVGGASLLNKYGFAVVGERLTCRIRASLFGAIVRQDMGWHDLPGNGPSERSPNAPEH